MSDRLDFAASLLRDAYTGGAVPPLRAFLGPFDADGAYAVQEINTRFWQAQGRRIVGRKAGLTAKAVQFERIGGNKPLRIPEVGGEFTGLKVSVFLEAEGAAHYLPAYAGNLDIMTSAALKTAERIALRMAEGVAA